MALILESQGTLTGAATLDLSTVVNPLDSAGKAAPGVVIVFRNRGTGDASILLSGKTISQVAETIEGGDPPFEWGGPSGILVPFATGQYTLSAAASAIVDYSIYRVV